MENERIVYTACPLCASADFREVGRFDYSEHPRWREPLDKIIIWVQCDTCQHVFTHGYFTDAALGVLFQSTNNEQIVGTDLEPHRGLSSKMVQRVQDAIGLANDRLWLDVGFGNGSLLMTAKEFGFSVYGIDLRERNVEDLRSYGIPAYHGTLGAAVANVTFPTRPSVISMADVLEHEAFPIESLRSARAVIQDGGVLVISMPNSSSTLWHHWDINYMNPYWLEIEHYHNFTRERLYEILKQTGFNPVRYAVSERYRGCMEVLSQAV